MKVISRCVWELQVLPQSLPALNQRAMVVLSFSASGCSVSKSPDFSTCLFSEFDSVLKLLCFLSRFFWSFVSKYWGRSSRKVFDESLLVLQKRDDGVSAGEKHCGWSNHTCGGQWLFLDWPPEDLFFSSLSAQCCLSSSADPHELNPLKL